MLEKMYSNCCNPTTKEDGSANKQFECDWERI